MLPSLDLLCIEPTLQFTKWDILEESWFLGNLEGWKAGHQIALTNNPNLENQCLEEIWEIIFSFSVLCVFPLQPHLNHSRGMKLQWFYSQKELTALKHLAWCPRVVTAHSSSFSMPWAADLNIEFTWTSKEAGRMELGPRCFNQDGFKTFAYQVEN